MSRIAEFHKCHPFFSSPSESTGGVPGQTEYFIHTLSEEQCVLQGRNKVVKILNSMRGPIEDNLKSKRQSCGLSPTGSESQSHRAQKCNSSFPDITRFLASPACDTLLPFPVCGIQIVTETHTKCNITLATQPHFTWRLPCSHRI